MFAEWIPLERGRGVLLFWVEFADRTSGLAFLGYIRNIKFKKTAGSQQSLI
jgi:hypothetical protein